MDLTPPQADLLISAPQGHLDYEAVFRAGVAPSALITPQMTIADVNEAYLVVAGRSRVDLVGADLLEFLRAAPGHDSGSDGPATLRASLLEVVRTGKPDVIDVLPYALTNTPTGPGSVRYFNVVNAPVLDHRGVVVWILHHLEEVTEYVNVGPASAPAGKGGPPAPHSVRQSGVGRRNRKLALQASHDRMVSRTLQDAMLTDLPEPDGLRLGARYIANTEADQVGGDWYDAAILTTGATIVAMGDVVGHDIKAAASMGQLRSLLRALAWDREESPAAVFERVERCMAGLKLDTLATAILGRIEKREGETCRRLQWSNAGHPPPLLVTEDGVVEILETENDLPLGAGFGLPRSDHGHRLCKGSMLLLYTDGLVERRDRPRDVGIGLLVEALRRYRHLPLERLLDEVLHDVADDAPEDDVAVLAIVLETET
jgi:hypothetical protein